MKSGLQNGAQSLQPIRRCRGQVGLQVAVVSAAEVRARLLWPRAPSKSTVKLRVSLPAVSLRRQAESQHVGPKCRPDCSKFPLLLPKPHQCQELQQRAAACASWCRACFRIAQHIALPLTRFKSSPGCRITALAVASRALSRAEAVATQSR